AGGGDALLAALALRIGTGGASSRPLRCRALPGRRQVYTRASRFRQSDCDRLLGRPRAVRALADGLDLLAYELARLRRRRLPLALVPRRGLERLLLGHADLRVSEELDAGAVPPSIPPPG